MPHSPEPLISNKNSNGAHEPIAIYNMKEQMNISTPLHHPNQAAKQEMRINSERVGDSLKIEDPSNPNIQGSSTTINP